MKKYSVLKVQWKRIFLDSSMVEHTAVNRGVVGSSPTRGVCLREQTEEHHRVRKETKLGSMVKRLRHRPFTAVTRVRFPLESFYGENSRRVFVDLCSSFCYNLNSLWRHGQVVRHGSATPLSPVRIWLAPLRNYRLYVCSSFCIIEKLFL